MLLTALQRTSSVTRDRSLLDGHRPLNRAAGHWPSSLPSST